MLPKSCQTTINKVEEATKNNTKFDFNLAICYTSQRDIVEATRKICKEVMEGAMKLEDVDEDVFEKQLSICGSRPPVDLVIRFGGHKRIGMLLIGWKVPHAELYFTDIHAPDFRDNVFLESIRSFQQRARWFGK
ncbi:Tritrans polycis-undecaprenyl-diphosphate synthase [Bienertia sinuspersici]